MRKVLFGAMLIFGLAVVKPAWAHYIWMDVAGQQTASAGDLLTFNVYAHADFDDEIILYAASVGFDDAALGGELTYVSYSLNTTDFMEGYTSAQYEQGGSEASPGMSWINSINAKGPSYVPVAVTAGSDILLFSITFSYTDPEYSWTGEDVWLEFETYMSEGVYWTSIGASPVTDIDASQGSADFASTAVPIPGAGILLGSGLLGLAGLSRKKRKG